MARKKDQSVALESLLTTAAMLELAGNRYYWRGNEYFEDGAVTRLQESGGVITGKVQGSRLYTVRIRVEDDELNHECSCPLGEDAEFCKHCVAVGLAWLAKDKPTPLAESGKKADNRIDEKDVRDFLMGKSKEALVEMLLEQCEEDERLNRRLLAMTARTSRDRLDLSVWKNALE
ncbi:MAG: SWIM zinc finger family protein [Magnetococcales bacterium]|nr:SWIM zinc finger family protein [Magnetococcales bacterium]